MTDIEFDVGGLFQIVYKLDDADWDDIRDDASHLIGIDVDKFDLIHNDEIVYGSSNGKPQSGNIIRIEWDLGS